MPTSTSGGRLDLPEMDREAVREQQEVAGGDAVADLALPDLRLLLVRQQDHHDLALAGGVRDVEDAQPSRLGVRAALRVRPKADDHVDAGFLQVQRVCMALGAVADDRNGLPLEEGRVSRIVVEDGHGRASIEPDVAASSSPESPVEPDRCRHELPEFRLRNSGLVFSRDFASRASPARSGAAASRTRSPSAP